jgi:hypothetical protein
MSNFFSLSTFRLYGQNLVFLERICRKNFTEKHQFKKNYFTSFTNCQFAQHGNYLSIFASATKTRAGKTIPVYNSPRALQHAAPWQHRKLLASTTKPSRLLVPQLGTAPAQSFNMCRNSSKYSFSLQS